MLHLYEHKTATKGILMDIAGVTSQRTLQNDLAFLRDGYMAEIIYSKKRSHYELHSSGNFLIDINATNREIDVLVFGLEIISCIIPHLRESASILWKKLSPFFPQRLSRRGENISKKIHVSIPSAKISARDFNALVNALCEGNDVELIFNETERSGKIISPQTLCFGCIKCYIEGFCRLDSRMEKLHLDNIRSVMAV
jgi:predicted DNA-binding transcriptional regulator YafY